MAHEALIHIGAGAVAEEAGDAKFTRLGIRRSPCFDDLAVRLDGQTDRHSQIIWQAACRHASDAERRVDSPVRVKAYYRNNARRRTAGDQNLAVRLQGEIGRRTSIRTETGNHPTGGPKGRIGVAILVVASHG